MLTTRINLKTLKAVSLAASTEQPRYYLNGVHVECRTDHVIYVSTNGHVMLVAREELPTLESGEERLTGNFIIPLDDCAPKLLRGDEATVILSAETKDAVRMKLGTHLITLIEGTFPDWRRVVPKASDGGEHAHFNPEYVALMGKFAKAMTGKPQDAVIQRGAATDPRAVSFGPGHAFGVIMPMRAKTLDWAGLPEWAS